MRTITLDGRRMGDRRAVHPYLKDQLQIEGYFGNNLDALWDALSTVHEPMRIELKHKEEMLQELSHYGYALLRVLKEADAKNEYVEFIETAPPFQ